MSKLEKLIAKILSNRTISYAEAEKILLSLGFDLDISSSHHIFRKRGYERTVSIKLRKELLPYQIREIQKILVDHGHKK